MEKIGEVKDYLDKKGVAIVELTGTLKESNEVRFKSSEEAEKPIEPFNQEPPLSMEIDKDKIKVAKPGSVIGLKVSKPVKNNCAVYKV